jgi:hypothetical protein
MGSNVNPLLEQMVVFIQHQIPGLEDGEYQLTVSQRVLDDTGTKVSDGSLTNTYSFAVLGDRFALSNPGLSVSSVFPPAEAIGKFTTVLPHVVFTSPTLPWARFPTNVPPYTPPPPGQDTDADVPTWLAVLVFDEDDVAAFPGLTLPPASATVGDLFRQSLVPASTLGNNYSYFWNAKDFSGLEADEMVEDDIQVLDVPLKLFWQVAPTIADLRLTAHVRQVSLLNKPTGQGPDPGVPLGTFSIVFATRLPQTQKKAYAYLVSLEELQDFLPTDEQGGPPAGNDYNADAFLRLAVLTSWTFYSTGQSATFVDGLLELNGRESGSTTDAMNTNLRLLYSGSNQVVGGALNMGYVPLNETLRTAGRTVSWYRGPCAPYSITEPALKLPIASPDEATVFDPTTGMFDLSYAAAWTLGRMLALQDTAFSTELYNWKKGLTQLAINAVEDQILEQQFSEVLTAGPAPAVLRNGRRPSTSRALFLKTIQSLKPVE